jgi:hypothetical protein
VNPLLSKNELDAFDKAIPTTLSGKAEQKPVELRLSGTHTQPLPFLNAAGQFGARLVQFAVRPAADRESRNPVVSKKVLAAMAGDPDPAASLADIRKLLVGPTRNLHDAMFEEVVTILEESDREVQQSLRSLERQCTSLSHITDELVSISLEGKEQNRKQAELLHKELQKSATSHQQMLSEMFLVIDSKIEELTTQVNQKIEALEKKIETDMRESAANHERNMQELEARCLASSKKAAGLLETRVAHLERKSSNDRADLSEVFAGGLSSMVDRLKALRDS